jgi:hypothetical protein
MRAPDYREEALPDFVLQNVPKVRLEGVRYPVRRACRRKTNPDGSLTLARNGHAG